MDHSERGGDPLQQIHPGILWVSLPDIPHNDAHGVLLDAGHRCRQVRDGRGRHAYRIPVCRDVVAGKCRILAPERIIHPDAE
eukprot:scaffold3894_cov51-Prasinocladus_malaysianus.AAC.1